MSPLLAQGEFTYGNTRLRGRRVARLRADELLELAARDLDGLYGALAATPYRTHVEAALARGGGTVRLHEAIRAYQAAEIALLRGFYTDRERELVDLLLSSYDVANLVALLRAALGGTALAAAGADIVPVGAFSGAVLRELAHHHEPAALVERLIAWRLPDVETARATSQAFARYERDQELWRLEHAILTAHVTRVATRLARLGDAARPLGDVLRRRIDERNLITALRARDELDQRPLASLEAPWLPGGTARPAALDAALRRPGAHDVAAALAATVTGSAAKRALGAWALDGDLAAAERELDNRRLLDEIALFYRGDPLGVAVPVAACAELELEARNLRVLTEGAGLDLGPDELRGRLLLPTR